MAAIRSSATWRHWRPDRMRRLPLPTWHIYSWIRPISSKATVSRIRTRLRDGYRQLWKEVWLKPDCYPTKIQISRKIDVSPVTSGETTHHDVLTNDVSSSSHAGTQSLARHSQQSPQGLCVYAIAMHEGLSEGI